LVDLGRHLGLFEPKRKHDGKVEVVMSESLSTGAISRLSRTCTIAGNRRPAAASRSWTASLMVGWSTTFEVIE
jgi:hypothetical protein